jgi:phosphogluconate dehydratase
MRDPTAPNVAIVTAYNDMLSAHQPFERFPDIIRKPPCARSAPPPSTPAAPAMCDGVTQGRPGMELSLFSRDVIAMSTGVALTHDAFDAALMLGICDKIVPGLFIGGLAFGHLPTIFVPGGPMTSGISNAEKARVRALYAEGKATRDDPAGKRDEELPLARHLHLLRHRQLQPDDDGDDRPAPALDRLRPPPTPACATP